MLFKIDPKSRDARPHRRRWPWIVGGALLLFVIAVAAGVSILSRHIQPRVHNLAVDYLEKRFDSTVVLDDIRVDVPAMSPYHWLVSRGHGVVLRVTGDGLTLRHRGRIDIPPLFAVRHFSFQIDVASLFKPNRRVNTVFVDGLRIHVPPEREGLRPKSDTKNETSIGEVIARDAELVILPKDNSKAPLDFRIQSLHLLSIGGKGEMKYDAHLTNPRPQGEIASEGTFGPWDSAEPGESPMGGKYTFSHADLSVFHGIAGILNATGQFTGQLDSIRTLGTAVVNDFRLTSANNPIPLTAHYDALIDGNNGDTRLQPVRARLGQTDFTTSGAVIRNDQNKRHSITLDVLMPKGRVEDLLPLAMKGPPMMTGEISMKSRIAIPPQSGKVDQKLMLDGQFHVAEGHFLKSKIQDKIDELSRRGQGQPKNQEIDEVFSDLQGHFHMQDAVISFKDLAFDVTGAQITLTGDYNLANDQIDMHGALSLNAKVSDTMTGIKRILLKPVDPFFEKHGAGTYLRIRLDGSSKDVHYGLDHGSKDKAAKEKAAR
jgi:hypothetical protein